MQGPSVLYTHLGNDHITKLPGRFGAIALDFHQEDECFVSKITQELLNHERKLKYDPLYEERIVTGIPTKQSLLPLLPEET